MAQPLTQLMHKHVDWHWETKEQEAFDMLKVHVTSEPILGQPDLAEQFILEVDASRYAVGTVLSQQKNDNKLHPIGYFLSTLNEVEKNYDIYDLELLAIIKALEN